MDPFKSGFVSIIGAPNVGKSTFLNRVVGEKISITSSKPQTTRNRILGVLHRPASQIVFLDTPGIHRAKTPLNRKLVETACSALSDADVVLMMVDAGASNKDSEEILLSVLKNTRSPVILALNKIDLIAKPLILKKIEEWVPRHSFTEIVPISSKFGDQIEALLVVLENMLPVGPKYYPDEEITDMPMRFLMAERIREKIYHLTGKEIPYSTAVTIEEYSKRKSKSTVYIRAVIHVERNSQKGILIGQGGEKLKKIGEVARHDMEEILCSKVYLELLVRVQKNWSRDTRAIKRFGYE
ncbi:MAG: GTPase Era [Thermodesulfobacteriota bacterium]